MLDGELAEDTVLGELQAVAWRVLASAPTDGADAGTELRRLRCGINILELAFARRAAAFDRSEQWDLDTTPSVISWLRSECNLTSGAASGAVAVGKQEAKLPEAVAAMQEGEIGFSHLALMAHTATALSETPGAKPFTERGLLGLAKRHSVSRFRTDCAHVRHAASERAFLERQVADRDYRELRLAPTEGGGLSLTGWFDAEGGAVIRTALEPLARRHGVGDDRVIHQRNADALVEALGKVLDDGVLPRVGGQRPHLQVAATLETLRNLPGAPAAEMDFAGAVSATTAQRLLCDSLLRRVLFDANSQVIDIGRKTRVVTAAMRAALHARDRGCVWPDCDRTAGWTVPHHVAEWVAHGGSTSVANLVSLCRRHHWMVHEGGWTLYVGDDGQVVVLPPVHEVGVALSGSDWARPSSSDEPGPQRQPSTPAAVLRE